ncbi:MAG: hypothetical protein JRH20_15910 [Deltaproteobacteria bacterium]|nr:hypothetical protein [Deltaproteobacteria bacterium]
MWFEDLMGFAEASPTQVRENIKHTGDSLVSKVNARRVRCGRLTLPSLAELRESTHPVLSDKRASLSEVVADVRALHEDPANVGALFQAASQFNLLEMASSSVTPEAGVGVYEHDCTQGPACAMACGGGTIFRNYFAPVGDQLGQTAEHQINGLADLLSALGNPKQWNVRNGYALPTIEGLHEVNAKLAAASDEERDELRGHLRIGVQHDVEVLGTEHLVTQVYGSALPVAYGVKPAELWEPFARLVLEASYEATLLVAQQQGIWVVYLTLLGGGVFGNHEDWIRDAILRALPLARGLDVRIVSYGHSNAMVQGIVSSAS